MRFRKQSINASLAGCALLFVFLNLAGCKNLTPAENVGVWGAVVTAVGASTPAQEIEQIYYLGVFDPQEQIPPTVYRVRVHGQASIISGMKFGSGWVPANLIDSLGSNISFKDGSISIDQENSKKLSSIQTGRRLVLFGPEGFREAPKDHRLVIVMGSSPEAFFNALDRSLGAINESIAEQRNEGISLLLLMALTETKNERILLDDLSNDIDKDLAVKN